MIPSPGLHWLNRRGLAAIGAACVMAASAQAANIVIQAENFQAGSNWNIGVSGLASGNLYAYANGDTTSDTTLTPATYKVSVPDTQTRSLYMRLYVPNFDELGAAEDSFLNDSMWLANGYNAAPGGPHLNDNYLAVGQNTWGWINATAGGGSLVTPGYSYAAPAPGIHDFNVAGREDGLRVDLYVLSTDPDLTTVELDRIAGFLPPIPEPTAFAIVLVGLAGLGLTKPRARRASSLRISA